MSDPWFSERFGLAKDPPKPVPADRVHWSDLRLSGHTQTVLYNASIASVSDIVEMTPAELWHIPGIGEERYWEIIKALDANGLALKGS